MIKAENRNRTDTFESMSDKTQMKIDTINQE